MLTGQDAKADGLGGIPPLFMPEDMGGPKGYRTFRPLLEAVKARYVGDRIAFVVAHSPAGRDDGPPDRLLGTVAALGGLSPQ